MDTKDFIYRTFGTYWEILCGRFTFGARGKINCHGRYMSMNTGMNTGINFSPRNACASIGYCPFTKNKKIPVIDCQISARLETTVGQ